MFTGIVEEVGAIRDVARTAVTMRLEIRAVLTLKGSEPGASLAVNGVCLTVVERRPDGVTFELGPETLARTAFGTLRPGQGNHRRVLAGRTTGHLSWKLPVFRITVSNRERVWSRISLRRIRQLPGRQAPAPILSNP